MLDGDILVESEHGKGTRFTLRISAQMDMATEVKKRAADKHVPASDHDITNGGRAKTVLVIDDDPNSRELLARHITSEGMQVITASSGEEGLERARQLKPDVITLDMFMEGFSGLDVLGALKEDPELRNVPVIMCTISDDRDTCLSLGAVDFLMKPVNRNTYIDAVRRYATAGPGANILIVDDLAENRDIMRRHLDGQGFEIIEAENGAEALKRLETIDTLQCVMLDIMMPVMDGFEFLKQFRQQEKWRTIPVFVITAKILDESERAFLRDAAEHVVDREGRPIESVLGDIKAAIDQTLPVDA